MVCVGVYIIIYIYIYIYIYMHKNSIHTTWGKGGRIIMVVIYANNGKLKGSEVGHKSELGRPPK